MFRSYKPKNLFRVQAVQVSYDNKQKVATVLMGRVGSWKTAGEDGHTVEGVEIPTFNGVKQFPIGSWILRDDDNVLSGMSNEEFTKTYEVAVNRTSSAT